MLLVLLLFTQGLAKRSPATYFYKEGKPLIIAHRGACGYIPEHTMQAYQVAAYMGADFIEPDLVPTKDGYLLINHDANLNDTSNVSELPEFQHLKTTLTYSTFAGKVTETGWFAQNFTLEQVKKLDAKQRIPKRPQSLNVFKKITIEEALDWVITENQKRTAINKPLLGAYIELKNPEYFNSAGFPVEDMLLKVLKQKGISDIKGASAKCPVVLQCFELQSLKYLSTQTDLPLTFLMKSVLNYDINEYKDAVNALGPNFGFIFGENGASSGFVEEAHELELAVHPWVVRDDFINSEAEVESYYMKLNYEQLDGVFTEFPDSAYHFFNLY